jgi:uncharacterized membrane protein
MDELIVYGLYIIAFFTGALLALFIVLIIDYNDLKRDMQKHTDAGAVHSH